MTLLEMRERRGGDRVGFVGFFQSLNNVAANHNDKNGR